MPCRPRVNYGNGSPRRAPEGAGGMRGARRVRAGGAAVRRADQRGGRMPARPRITVLGSLNIDISVSVQRLPAPGETVLGPGAVIAPGGKGANQAVAAARLGGAVRMTGCTGDDDFARMARSALEADGVDVSGVRAAGGFATGLALITVDAAGENMIT